MTVQRQIGFWIAALVVAVLLLFVLRDILLPFVAGFALAYLLDPVADRLQRLGLGRLGATPADPGPLRPGLDRRPADPGAASRRSRSRPSSTGCPAMWRGCRSWSPSRAAR